MDCNVGALGGFFDSGTQTNYTVVANGKTINPGELFTPQFLGGRTRELVEAVVKNLNGGATVTDDGSVIASNAAGSTFRTAPAGSVIVAKYRMLYPKPTAVAMGVPLASTPSTKVLAVSPSAPPTAAQAVPGGTPAPVTVTSRPGVDLGGVLGTALNIGLDLYGSREARKTAEATAKAATAQAYSAQLAAQSPILAPPTGPAQGSAVNYAPAAYGYGFGSGAQAPAPALSLPALPSMPAAPASLPDLPISGPVIQPGMLQGVSPTTGLATPVFPGLPQTSETGDGRVNLNAASLTQLMAKTAADAQPLPPPSGGMPWKTLAIVAVVAGGIYLATRRRRR